MSKIMSLLLLIMLLMPMSAYAKGIDADIENLKTPTLTTLHLQDPAAYPTESGYTLTQIFPADTTKLPPNTITKYLKDAITNELTPVYFRVNINTEYGTGPDSQVWGWVKDADGKNIFVKDPVGPSTSVTVRYDGTTALPPIENTADKSTETITGSFVNNTTTTVRTAAQGYNYVGGGAIYNSGADAKLGDITADFIGNTAVNDSYTTYGGAIYNKYGTIGDITGDFIGNSASSGGAIYIDYGTIGDITGDFIGNSASYGGAIYDNNGTIGNITGDFIGNSASYGGAIYNDYGTIGNITGDFIGNSASIGGAIYNQYGTIKDITGDFIGNYASSSGGAINNNKTIGNITGDFIGNYSSSGGAIINYSGTIGDITGDFIGNYVSSSSYADGGAISNNAGKIGNITGDFIGNYVSSELYSINGGAIYNDNGTIGDITGDFIGNYSISKNTTISPGSFYEFSPTGGAICFIGGGISSTIGNINGNFKDNYATTVADAANGGAISLFRDPNNSSVPMTMGNVTGTFTNNYVYSSAYEAKGGAIFAYNGTIGDITGDFINNYAYGEEKASGGAIYSIVGKFGNITGNFKGNHAVSLSGDAQGGAIYDMNYKGISNINGTFTDNYVSSPTSAQGGAVYTGIFGVNIKGDFFNNYASSNADAQGGAIYIGFNVAPVTITDASFQNNRTIAPNANGGAIYVAEGSSLNLIASQKDILFENNYTASSADGPKTSNAIHINRSSVNLNAGDHKIVFNDRITSEGEPNTDPDPRFNVTININQTGTWDQASSPNTATGNKLQTTAPTTGTVVLNEDMSGYTGAVNLYAGTLKLGENGTFFNSNAFTISDNTTLDIKNKKLDTINNITLNGNLNYAMDVDYDKKTGDTLNIIGSANGNVKIIDIGGIGTLNASTGSFTHTFLTGAGASGITTELLASLGKIYGQTYTYDVTVNGKDLNFTAGAPIGGLSGAVAAPDTARTYIMDTDEIVTDWQASTKNDLQGGNLVIKGNGNSILGQNNQGIIVNNGQSLEANGVGNETNNSAWQNFTSENGGALKNTEGTVIIKDSTFKNNTANNQGGAIYNENGTVNIKAENTNVVFENNTANGTNNALHSKGGNVNLNAQGSNQIIFNDAISSDSTATLNINSSTTENSTSAFATSNEGTIVLNADMKDFKGDINLHHGTLKVGKDGTFFNNVKDFNVQGCTLDLANGITQDSILGNLSIANQLEMKIDANLAELKIDTISAANTITDADKINVTQINLLSDAASENTTLNFAKDSLKGTVTYSGADVSYSPIYKYHVAYDKNSGDFTFNRFVPSNNNSDRFNPAVLATPVAAQVGGYLTQLKTYEQAFNNIDMYMLMPQKARTAMKYRNKYASNDSNLSFSPLMTPYADKGAWFKPYSTFESVPLKNGPTVSNVAYGSLFGVDSDIVELKHGFDGMMSVYTGYTGSHQAYQGNSIYQNGAVLGLTGVLYKNNFFSALTANTGTSVGDATTMYGSDTFTMLMAGIASKTGYNWELKDGKFIIQPSLQMSYTFVNTFDYTNKAGTRINSSPLNALQIAPGVKFIGNLKNGWQPYATVAMAWNIMDETKFKANNVQLPNMSVDPYVMYGVGIQKQWADRFSAFGQAMMQNGGRSGISFNFGFRWMLGRR